MKHAFACALALLAIGIAAMLTRAHLDHALAAGPSARECAALAAAIGFALAAVIDSR